jgi:hypothetical protein
MRSTLSNWERAIRIHWRVRTDSVSALRFHVAKARHAKAFKPQKIWAFAIFSAVPSYRWTAVTNRNSNAHLASL